MDSVLAALGALVPPVGVGLVFWFVLRSIIRADRSERAAITRLDAEESGRGARPAATPAPGAGTGEPERDGDEGGARP